MNEVVPYKGHEIKMLLIKIYTVIEKDTGSFLWRSSVLNLSGTLLNLY